MAWNEVAESTCPIARALAVLGDRWTMLIVRELFLGTRRFDEFQAQTGMSSHLLASRLKRLELDGIVERRLYSERPPRREYRLTTRGKDLLGIVLALRAWGLRWGGLDPDAEPAVRLVHRSCGAEPGPGAICPGCGEILQPQDIEASLAPPFAAERAARREAFAGARSPASRS